MRSCNLCIIMKSVTSFCDHVFARLNQSSPHLHLHLSFNRVGRWGTTDEFTISFFYFSLFSTTLWDFANSRPVHSPMLSCHLFLCLPCLLHPFTVTCKMVLARPNERHTCPYHFSLFTMVRRFRVVRLPAQTSSLVTWSLYEVRSILP